MSKSDRDKILLGVYLALLFLTVVLVVRFIAPREAEVKKIGFVTAGRADTEDWESSTYRGILEACNELGVSLLVRPQVPEQGDACVEVVDDLADEGVEMIILSAPGYSQAMEHRFADYPQVAFYGLYAHYAAANLTGYSLRMYQARYLSGIIAGYQTKTDRIGFVATSRTSETCRGINAFALGVQRVAPEAEVLVIWADELGGDDAATRAARMLILDEDVDVITYHQNQHSVIDVAEEAGIYSIGYYEELDGYSDRYLTCAACDWKILYEHLIQECLRGQSRKTASGWLGLESGAVVLTEYSPRVPRSAIREVELAQDEILNGLDVFTGVIYDNTGKLRCGEGESMSDDTLMQHMDWLVRGVRECN